MTTATQEIESWIEKHGNARDALNVSLVRLSESQRTIAEQAAEIGRLRGALQAQEVSK